MKHVPDRNFNYCNIYIQEYSGDREETGNAMAKDI